MKANRKPENRYYMQGPDSGKTLGYKSVEDASDKMYEKKIDNIICFLSHERSKGEIHMQYSYLN